MQISVLIYLLMVCTPASLVSSNASWKRLAVYGQKHALDLCSPASKFPCDYEGPDVWGASAITLTAALTLCTTLIRVFWQLHLAVNQILSEDNTS
jgi:hypothetical protein